MTETLTTIDQAVHEAMFKITAPSVHEYMKDYWLNERRPTTEMLASPDALIWAMEALWEVAGVANDLSIKVLETIIEEA